VSVLIGVKNIALPHEREVVLPLHEDLDGFWSQETLRTTRIGDELEQRGIFFKMDTRSKSELTSKCSAERVEQRSSFFQVFIKARTPLSCAPNLSGEYRKDRV
jgi:hypothetical protein